MFGGVFTSGSHAISHHAGAVSQVTMLLSRWPLAVTTADGAAPHLKIAGDEWIADDESGSSVGNLQDAGLVHRHEDRLNRARRRRGSEEKKSRR